MKKLGFLLVLILLGLVITGCSNDDETAATDDEISGEITVWAHPYTSEGDAESQMWDEIIAGFEEEYDVSVNFEQIPWNNRDQKILTALAANDGPDVFYAIPDQMPQYAEEGMLMELDPYLEDMEDKDDFVGTAMDAVSWKGKTYGLPILQEAYTLFYNTEVIEAIGEDPEDLPETWEEFDEWAKKAKEEGYYARSFPGGGSMNGTLYPWIWQAGGKVITEDSEVLINSDESVKAFERLNRMYKDGMLPEDAITAMEHNALWDNGEMLATLGSGITLTNLLEKDVVDFVIGPPLKNQEQLTYGTTGMFVVPSNSDNKSAAAEFVKHMTNTENQRNFNSVTQYIPTRESAKDIFDDEKHLSQLSEYTQYALPGVIHPIGRDIMSDIQAQIQTMMEGEKTPQEAAGAAAEAIKGKLEE